MKNDDYRMNIVGILSFDTALTSAVKGKGVSAQKFRT